MFFASRAMIRDGWPNHMMVNALQRDEALSADELQHRARKHLHQTLQVAIGKLPYYAEIASDFSVNQSEEVLRNCFPVIDKATLLDNPTRLYPHAGSRRPWESVGKTSGTTGTPLSISRSMRSVLMENAFIKRHWAWAGFHDGMKRATLRGDMVVGLQQATPPFWFMNHYNRQLLLSSRHLTDSCVIPIMNELERFAPHILQAYPSTAYTLALYLKRHDRRVSIPFVFTASEPLYSHQREMIEERFGCKIMDMYGMAERVAFATQCEFGEMHINSDYSYVEILDEKGHPTDDYGYVTGTTFHNHAMPLVRYRLSDRTKWKRGQCLCGRAFPMIEPVTGKFEDRITGSDGVEISPSILTFAFKGVENIRKSQVAQLGPGRWEVRIVPAPAFELADQRKLIANIHELVDARIDVNVVLKDELSATAAGKFQWVVNESR
ncbi:MAG TPA: AMP-binding protein [Burkholderiaceae bacterium]|nr:AMP-binding protein [Burkholderiaceae bacterium]